jgi:hypothetical protein
MTSSDFDQSSGGLTVNQNKAARTASDTPMVYRKRIVLTESVELLTELSENQDPDTRLFPYQVIPMQKLETCIKESAQLLRLNPKFRWSLHSLHQGGMQTIKAELESKGLIQLLEEATRVSDSVRIRYLRPHAEPARGEDGGTRDAG